MKNLLVADDEKPKKASLFDYIRFIEQKKPWKELSEEDQKGYSPFMINRLISSRDQFTEIISKIDTLKMNAEQHYTFLTTIMETKTKIRFDLDSYKKQKVDEDEKLTIFAIRKEYQVGTREAKSYINMISDQERLKLLDKWKDYYELYGE